MLKEFLLINNNSNKKKYLQIYKSQKINIKKLCKNQKVNIEKKKYIISTYKKS